MANEVRWGELEVKDLLLAESSVTDLIQSDDYGPLVFVSHEVPEAYQDYTDFLQVYRMSTVAPDDYSPTVCTVNCRSTTESKANKLAQAVRDALNRYLDGTAYATCNVYESIREEQNDWNTPVDVTIYRR